MQDKIFCEHLNSIASLTATAIIRRLSTGRICKIYNAKGCMVMVKQASGHTVDCIGAVLCGSNHTCCAHECE